MTFRKKNKSAFNDSALIIGEEMKKWDNFGIIYDETEGYRIFYGGYSDNIKAGIAEGLVHLSEMIGDYELIDEVSSMAINILEDHMNSIKQ